ncbi:hypothetical protein CWE22_10860 [Pseudidiomarina aestuarii]|uniref:Replication initiation factor n=1 Tax=Pseudidiomarina aestuarii TaxID=624146 RepID=A0A7Z6ZS59_9GAMM|nr:hypothetical protein [Pseudidiomarina aestuarii]RUO39243.1 hypothetical protein CWE22_10860 [Pseudidiomarina aestuarii]
MPKNEPIQKNEDDDNQFDSKKRIDFVVDNDLADKLGAPPCNTAPPKYDKAKVLRSGVDSLYLSFHGVVHPHILKELEEKKTIAADERCRGKAAAALHLADIPFRVMPKGQGLHRYVIMNRHLRIRIAGERSGKAPTLYMEISSEFLSIYGYQNALQMTNAVADHLVSSSNGGSLSRLDLCVDFTTNIDWRLIDPARWVCRSTHRAEYRESDEITGFVFGQSGSVMSRLYDKTREIEKSEKFFFRELWTDCGWSGNDKVWRLEFQLRQEFLKSASQKDPFLLIDVKNSIWRYLTQDWLSLRDQTTDSNHSRWPVADSWHALSQATFNSTPAADLKRVSFVSYPSDKSIFIGALGFLTSFMVKARCESLDEALQKFIPLAARYFANDEKQPLALDEYVCNKLAEKKLRFFQIQASSEGEK